jgi:hypothetical protein
LSDGFLQVSVSVQSASQCRGPIQAATR